MKKSLFIVMSLLSAVLSDAQTGIGTTSPNSTLHVAGSMALPVTVQTGNYTVTASNYSIICNNTSGAVTITLPAAAGCNGRTYFIKRISSIILFNDVIIEANGSETIDGQLTRTLLLQYEAVLLQSDGTNWHILSRYIL